MRTKHEYRTMRRDNRYSIEERYGDGDWSSVCECSTVNEAKGILRNLRALEGEEDVD